MLFVLCLAFSTQAREAFGAQGTYVNDGDTLWVQANGGGAAHKLRLTGIDAPEICQHGGKAARDFLTQLALRRRVAVKVSYVDR